ncbi:MAG: hypothetical protein C4520_06780 [Candidatus Abyssobacteria bacterium SURF_5]|uniref:Uncharacterized protein n=1 Tax=Abyssobacteria bacterium (strain SURF_5) TaxID=2093360 RepID=A0A3A4P1M8_ABYX5|nr:MAG: hypothetical protein C4520_06780 [Candidatus Abyssubacteria bacterium SURF_5]
MDEVCPMMFTDALQSLPSTFGITGRPFSSQRIKAFPPPLLNPTRFFKCSFGHFWVYFSPAFMVKYRHFDLDFSLHRQYPLR